MLLVKLADRLHNMRTLHFVPPEKRARIAQETLDIYAPLAGRIGMQRLREELESLAFRHLTPEAYLAIETRLEELRAKNGRIIRRVEEDLKEEFAKRGIEAAVTGRQKTPYSVWRKMERKSISFEQLSDIFGFRIVVGDVEAAMRRSASFTRNGRPFRGVSRIISRRPSRMTIARSTRPWWAPAISASSCRSAPRRCMRSPVMASPPILSTRTSAPPRGASISR